MDNDPQNNEDNTASVDDRSDDQCEMNFADDDANACINDPCCCCCC